MSDNLAIQDSEIDTVELRSAHENQQAKSDIVFKGEAIGIGNTFALKGCTGPIPIKKMTVGGISSGETKAKNEPNQTLQLKNCTVRNIIFESGDGEVILLGDSKVTGEITGGKIRD